MPLVAHSGLPAFATLRDQGLDIISAEKAAALELPALRIGMLNMMPDAALQATERQFLRLLAAYGSAANLYVHPFALPAEYRSEIAVAHIDNYYSSFADLREQDLHALIITGANPITEDITREAFWTPLMEVIDWGTTHVQSILCSCLATHAVMHEYYRSERVELPQRQWGVYEHELLQDNHPLLSGVRPPVSAPHSHRFAVSRADMERVGVTVLISSAEAGVHMAVSYDELRFVFFQGHPEYDAISLLKEYKREIQRFLTGNRSSYPPFPEHYLDTSAKARLEAYQRQLTESDFEQQTLPPFPEAELTDGLVNTWSEVGRVIYRNWLEQVRMRA
ncbi:MAG: homoserine O-succinyltransferase [Gammaproteobacteria bacterium]|nr:homoserine O-succinyltransferase [Gammaproteobacteria bacterium]